MTRRLEEKATQITAIILAMAARFAHIDLFFRERPLAKLNWRVGKNQCPNLLRFVDLHRFAT